MGLLQILGLLFFLVALPAGSWYYLSRGLDYRMSALEELEEVGPIPAFGTIYHNGKVLPADMIEDKMVVTSFLNMQNEKTSEALGQVLYQLHDQFDAREEVLFFTYVLNRQDSTEQLDRFIEQHELQDTAQCIFLLAEDAVITDQARGAYQLPLEEGQTLDDQTTMVFTDRDGIIRGYYDITKEARQKRLVEHIAMLLPKKKDRELVFQREKEK